MRWRSKAIGCLSRSWAPSAWFLGVRLELLLQRRELGERRIRVGLAVAAVPAVAAALDVFRAQRRIAIRAFAVRAALGALAVRRPIATLRSIEAFVARMTRGTIRAGLAVRAIRTIRRTPVPMPSLRRGRGRSRSGIRGFARIIGAERSGLAG